MTKIHLVVFSFAVENIVEFTQTCMSLCVCASMCDCRLVAGRMFLNLRCAFNVLNVFLSHSIHILDFVVCMCSASHPFNTCHAFRFVHAFVCRAGRNNIKPMLTHT